MLDGWRRSQEASVDSATALPAKDVGVSVVGRSADLSQKGRAVQSPHLEHEPDVAQTDAHGEWWFCCHSCKTAAENFCLPV